MTDPALLHVKARYGALAGAAGSLSCGRAAVLAGVRPGARCPDLGCGRGRDAIALAEGCGPAGRVVGVDATPAMIEQARRAAAESGLGHVDFVLATLDRLPLDDDSIDLVVSNCAINHARDKAAVWREVRRVLAPKGRFVVSDIYSMEPVPARWRDDPAAVAECWAGAVTRAEYLDTLTRLGFAEIRVLEESEPYVRGAVRLASFTVCGLRSPDPEESV